MSLGKLQLFQQFSQRMRWLSERQQVLTQNIANADTPGYLAKDVKPLSFKDMMTGAGSSGSLQMVSTNAAHLAGVSATAERTAKVENVRNPTEISNTGNTVSIEDETRKAAENNMDYQLVTNLYKKQVGLLMTAIGRGK